MNEQGPQLTNLLDASVVQAQQEAAKTFIDKMLVTDADPTDDYTMGYRQALRSVRQILTFMDPEQEQRDEGT